MSERRSAVLAAWVNAWLAGQCGTSDVLSAVTAKDAPHQVAGLVGFETELVSLREVLIAWRRSGGSVRVVLPVAGDVRGVPGPVAFRGAALEAGEAVVGAGLGLVPHVISYPASSAPDTVRWQAFAVEAAPYDYIQLSEAQRDLGEAIRESAAALAAADVAGGGAGVAEALQDARRAGERLRLPPEFPPPAVALLAQAERLQAVLDLALADPTGGAIDRTGIAARAAGLKPLIDAVRRARIAGYNANASSADIL